MNSSIIAAIIYGILAIVGGIMGYIQAQSKVSLISGSISGLLLIFGGVMQLQGQAWGLFLATVVTAVLVIIFTIRWAKTRKFMPAGLMTVLGVVTLVVIVPQLLEAGAFASMFPRVIELRSSLAHIFYYLKAES